MSDSAPTAVVSCFLLRRDRGQDEFLLVRRSDRVRTYRGYWAAVSGYLEPDTSPETQAYTEVREETGLDAADVLLARTGTPLPVHDADQGLEWIVHPFLFLVLTPERVRTDWEAREARWVAPTALAVLPKVPGLAAALAQVYSVPAPDGAARADDMPGGAS